MRRADRLFDIVQYLRRNKLVRASDLARDLEVSERTIYRDIAALIASGVPIEGEAGVGYLMREEIDLPPLMFNVEEIEALVFGARIVESWADPALAKAAVAALRKIEAVLPDNLQSVMSDVAMDAPAGHYEEPILIDRTTLREAIRARRKIDIVYCSKAGDSSQRTIRPLLVSFFGAVWNLTAWCELRRDFRTFRLDLIREAAFREDTFEEEPGKRLADLMARSPEMR
ncbi:MAG: YafY family protein [Pseudomonadota bacterium]